MQQLEEAMARLVARGISEPEPGSLHLIGTPIGNLGDLSPRAVRALASLDCLYCEDTRTTQTLLQVLGLSLELRSFTDHNEQQRIGEILDSLEKGLCVGLSSEAGMPLISDPGAALVAQVITSGFPVSVIPGPSAVMLALVGSGLPVTPHLFVGFPPRKAGERERFLAGGVLGDWTTVFFESPNRVDGLLASIAKQVEADRPVVVARELSKRFETYHRGCAGAPPSGPWKGECVVLVGPGTARESGEPEDLEERVDMLLAAGLGAKSISKLLAGLAPRKRLYDLALKRS